MNGYTWDAIERIVWTLIEVSAGAVLDVLTTGDVTWRAIGYAVLIAVLKVIVARNVGDKDSAATLPSPPDHAHN